MMPPTVPARAEASLSRKARAKEMEANPISQEEKDGARRALAAKAKAKALAKAKARSQTWMTKDGHMSAPQEMIGTGPQARSGALQPRPSQDGPCSSPVATAG